MKRARPNIGSPRRLLHPQDHGALEHITLHPQLGVLNPQPLQLGKIIPGQAVPPGPYDLITSDPVAERALVDPKITSNLRDRPTSLVHQPHRTLAELRVELPTLLWHDYSS